MIAQKIPGDGVFPIEPEDKRRAARERIIDSGEMYARAVSPGYNASMDSWAPTLQPYIRTASFAVNAISADRLEDEAYVQAREFFGPGCNLLVVRGWDASRTSVRVRDPQPDEVGVAADSRNFELRFTARIRVVAVGPFPEESR